MTILSHSPFILSPQRLVLARGHRWRGTAPRVLGALLGTEHTLQPGGQASVLGHEAIHVMVLQCLL